jgi:L-gulono-1,4-lactone dehydrogenase
LSRNTYIDIDVSARLFRDAPGHSRNVSGTRADSKAGMKQRKAPLVPAASLWTFAVACTVLSTAAVMRRAAFAYDRAIDDRQWKGKKAVSRKHTRSHVTTLATGALATVLRHPALAWKSARAGRRRKVPVHGTGAGPRGSTRETWRNAVGNQVAQPMRMFYPTTLEELQDIVRTAARNGCRVKAVGSGHSFSDIALTTDYLIDPHGLRRVLELDSAVLRQDWNPGNRPVVHLENGIRICDINEALDARGLGLINAGSYTAQTIIGAMSTSTHGSGIRLGALPDIVRSVEVVDQQGVLTRIEPAGGITDPAAFSRAYPHRLLIQNDNVFYSSVVANGCLGVVYSVIVEVRERYFLKEVRTWSTWDTVKNLIQAGSPLLTDNRHVDLYLNPHPVDGEHACVVGTRNEVPVASPTNARDFLSEFLAALPGMSAFFRFLFNTFYTLTPDIIQRSMRTLLESNYTNVSYKVLDLGAANHISAYSSEIAFPLESDAHLRGIDAILDVARECREQGELYLTVPIGIRFVKASPHYLSMMHGRDTCMVEVPCINGTQGGMEMLRKIEERVCTPDMRGRPHWGQVNFLNLEKIRRMYAATFSDWHAVYQRLNSTRIFSNSFTNRCSFD